MVATDIDGTLLGSDGAVSERNRQALHDARRQGRTVVLATGRPIRYVANLATSLTIDVPIVCANGAVLYDATSDEVLAEDCLALDVYEHVLTTLKAEIEGLAFAVETARAFTCEPAFADLAVWPVAPGAVASNGRPLCEGAPAKILVRHHSGSLDATLARIQQAVGDVVTITHSTPELLEIAALGVDKAAGLARLADGLGVGASDVVAFGDMPNDVAMLQWAGRGVAVANAHDAVLAVADEVTASNDDDGVARVVETLAPMQQLDTAS